MISVFSGKGVNVGSVQAFVRVLGASKGMSRGAKIWIFPGGECGEWEIERKKVTEFVEGGGVVLGFCGGAYFLSRESTFMGQTKTREDSLFEGRAVGPISETGDYRSPQAALAVRVSSASLGAGRLYNQGGCYFEGKANVLATYEDLQKPAIIWGKKGKGRYVLCGCHPEFAWDFPAEGQLTTLAKMLQPHEPFRKDLLAQLFSLS
jgi:glutamine amidotransferase-like uncharacterized protein